MLEKLVLFDRSLFLSFNGQHAYWLDPVMYWASNSIVWLPLFVFLLFLVIKTFRWKTLTVLVAVALLITVSDQLSEMVKNDVKRFRPSHEPTLAGNVHIVKEYRGGKHGFYSAHASSTFALAVFLIILFQKRYRYLYLLLLGWASLMTYTRIYLGVHYPFDLMCGATVGCLLGWFTGRITIWLLNLQGQVISRPQ